MGILCLDAGDSYMCMSSIRENSRVSSVLPRQVTALNNHGRASAPRELSRLVVRFLQSLGRVALTEHREFGNIRSDNICLRHQFAQCLLGVLTNQAIAAGGNHHRIKYHHWYRMFCKPGLDGSDSFNIAEHTNFNGIHSHIVKNCRKLFL